MSARDDLLNGFQWLATPHGLAADDARKLEVTIRVMPQLDARCFKNPASGRQQLGDLDARAHPLSVRALMDWPRFVSGIGNIKLGFSALGASRGAHRLADVTPRWHTHGAQQGTRSKLWTRMFGPELRVNPEQAPDARDFSVRPKSRDVAQMASMPHADGAKVLRAEIGRAHLFGMLDYVWPREIRDLAFAVRERDFRAGIVQSRFLPTHGGSVQFLAQTAAAPTESGAELMRRFQQWMRDVQRILAVGFPQGLLDSRLITAWNSQPLAASTMRPGAPNSLSQFLLHRAFATAPDLRAPIESQATMSLTGAEPPEPDDDDRPEFHRDMGKLTSHPWLMDVLGLTLDATVDIPADWNGTGGLYVHSIQNPELSVEPTIQSRVITGAAHGWLPKEDTDGHYSNGFVRLGMLDDSGEQAYALEQLDIDSASEKLLSVIQTLSSQFEAGVPADQREATLSTLRTTGISLLMRNSASIYERLTQRLEKVRGCAKTHGYSELEADDLIVGFRPDIGALSLDVRGGSCAAKWKSLTGRKLERLRFQHGCFEDDFSEPPIDEAFVSPHGRLFDALDDPSPVDPASSRRRFLAFEEIFCWRGWSLGAAQVETADRDRDAPSYIPEIAYRPNGGLPSLRFGWGYRIGARAVYVDGRSRTLQQAIPFYSDRKNGLTLGTGEVGGERAGDPDRYFTPFLRYEAVQPAKVTARRSRFDRRSTEREDRMLVTSDGHGRIKARESRRELTAPTVDLESAIRAGMFDTAVARQKPPRSGFVPDPWAKRLIIGIYRKADGELLRMEYFDYCDRDHVWPNARQLTLELIAETAEALPPLGFDTAWTGDTLTIRLAAGMSLEVKYWHEMNQHQLAASGVVEAMARWLSSTPVDPLEQKRLADTRQKLEIDTLCTEFCDMRDKLIKVIAQWHEKFPFDLRPYFAAGQPARDVALTSFSMLNPAGTIELVHAVPIPAREPLFSQADRRVNKRMATLPMTASEVARRFDVERRERGSTVAYFIGDAEIHRASTERVECFGRWQEKTDDPSLPTETITEQTQPMFRVERIKGALKPVATLVEVARKHDGRIIARPGARADLPPDNDLLMLDPSRSEIGRTENDDFGTRRPHFDFGDAKARLIHFELRAVSRYANDFPQATHHRDSQREESRWLKATLPPAKPEVAFIVPLFETEVARKDASVRHRRHGGWFRIWLERPWYSSGDGELLALVCAPGELFRARGGSRSFLVDKIERAWGSLTDAVPSASAAPKFSPSEHLQRLYTGWGLDPIWSQPKARLFFIPPGAFANRIQPDLPGPVVPSQFAGLAGIARKDVEVALALYRPEFDKQERRWFVDIQIVPDDYAYFPFVRLGLARFQPNAIPGCELSEIVASEFVQLAPERSATVTVDRGRVRIEILGPAPARLGDPRAPAVASRMVMRIDKAVGSRSSGVPTLWEPLLTNDAAQLEEVDLDYAPDVRTWRAEKPYALAAGTEYSIYLEEREHILVDADSDSKPSDEPVVCSRVIYANRIQIPARAKH